MNLRRNSRNFLTKNTWSKSSGNSAKSTIISVLKMKAKVGCFRSWTSSTRKRLNQSRFSATLSKTSCVWTLRKWLKWSSTFSSSSLSGRWETQISKLNILLSKTAYSHPINIWKCLRYSQIKGGSILSTLLQSHSIKLVWGSLPCALASLSKCHFKNFI